MKSKYSKDINNQLSCLENVNLQLSVHYLVYKFVNNVNGKYYIGLHKTEDINDGYLGSGDLINAAEEKYGLSNFTKIILFDFDNFDDMNNKEIELVQLSNCFPYNLMSYNLRAGGSTLLSDISKEKLSISLRLRFANMTDEELKIFSMSISKALSGINNPMFGKTHTLSSKIKMSNKNSGTKDKFWIFNESLQINKCVFISELQKYLDNGWKLGRINLKQNKNKKPHKGLKWIHNKDLKLETAQSDKNIQFYLNKGWKFGRLPKELRLKTSNKKIWKWMINKELKIKCRVYQENFLHFLLLGFKFGSRINRLK